MTDFVIGLSGVPGVGTKAIANLAASGISDVQILLCSDLIEEEAHLSDPTIPVLQDAGQQLVSSKGGKWIADGLLQRAERRTKTLIIDGIRHDSVWAAIQAKCQRHLLVDINVPEATVIDQLMFRRGIGPAQARAIAEHPVETSRRSELLEMADVRFEPHRFGNINELRQASVRLLIEAAKNRHLFWQSSSNGVRLLDRITPPRAKRERGDSRRDYLNIVTSLNNLSSSAEQLRSHVQALDLEDPDDFKEYIEIMRSSENL